MSATMLLFGILPLIIFVLIDSFAGLKAGIISAIVFALVEMLYSYVVYKRLDALSFGSLVLVLVFGLLSLKTDNPLFFKFQPVILGLIFGLTLLIMQFLGKPLLVLMTEKYQYLFPENARLNFAKPFMQMALAKLSHVLGWGLLLHSIAVAYAALFMSNWWWLAIRGVGLYFVMALCAILVRLSL